MAFLLLCFLPGIPLVREAPTKRHFALQTSSGKAEIGYVIIIELATLDDS